MKRPAALRALAPLAVLLSACGESSAPACATQVAPEVCSTPAQLRGAEPVQATAGSTQVQLPPAPLAEGRYVLVASSYSCPPGSDAPAPPPVQGVLELSGCVLRRTLISEALPERVEVFELSAAADGVLALRRACPGDARVSLQASYGFDGERLELGRLQLGPEQAAPESAAAEQTTAEEGAVCDTLESWALR